MTPLCEMLSMLILTDEFVEAVVRAKEEHARKYSEAEEIPDDSVSIRFHELLDIVHLPNDWIWRYDVEFTDLLKQYVFDILPTPCPITPKELNELIQQQLSWVPPVRSEIKQAAARIAAFADKLADDWTRFYDVDDWPVLTFGEGLEGILGKTRVAISEECLKQARGRAWSEFATILRDEEKLDYNQSPDGYLRFVWDSPIWESATGFSLMLLPGFGEVCELHSLLTGNVTEGALSSCRAQIKPVIQSIMKTAELAAVDSGRPPEQYFGPRIGYMYRKGAFLIRSCLDAYFAGGRTDSSDIIKRLHNAVALLVNADQVEHAGISLALCFASMEAILSEQEEGAGPTKALKNYVSVLLQPDGTRRDEARRNISRLYDRRNAVMHGRGVDGDPELRDASRKLAAGVLRAVFSHQQHIQSMGKELTHKDLIDELEISHRKDYEVVGVPDLGDLLPKDVPKLK